MKGLQNTKAAVTVTWLTMLYSRGFRYVWVGYTLLTVLYAGGTMKASQITPIPLGSPI